MVNHWWNGWSYDVANDIVWMGVSWSVTAPVCHAKLPSSFSKPTSMVHKHNGIGQESNWECIFLVLCPSVFLTEKLSLWVWVVSHWSFSSMFTMNSIFCHTNVVQPPSCAVRVCWRRTTTGHERFFAVDQVTNSCDWQSLPKTISRFTIYSNYWQQLTMNNLSCKSWSQSPWW